jgi:uncharacterized membrane protein YphA (DoxX/SURF4 family)
MLARRNVVTVISFLLRISVALTFVIAGTLKILDPAKFAEQTSNYQFFVEYSNYVGAFLPPIEIVASIALVFSKGHWRTASFVVLFGLLGVFTTAILRAWALGINLECGCFGEGSTNIGVWPVLRNLALMTALALSVFLDFRGLQRLPARTPSLP